MDTPVYLHESFAALAELLMTLKVVGAIRHSVPVNMMSVRGGTGPLPLIPKHWIPLPATGTHLHFLEFVPYKRTLDEKVR